jgi:hypothetical protein
LLLLLLLLLLLWFAFFSPSSGGSIAVSFEWIWMTILPTLSVVIASWILAVHYLYLGQEGGR